MPPLDELDELLELEDELDDELEELLELDDELDEPVPPSQAPMSCQELLLPGAA